MYDEINAESNEVTATTKIMKKNKNFMTFLYASRFWSTHFS